MALAAWGDSLTWGSGVTGDQRGTYPADLEGLLAPRTTVWNGGEAGDSSTTIKDRMVADTTHQKWPAIIWAGRNNYADAATVEADIATMVSTVGSSDYLVLSVTNGEGEGTGTTAYNEITALDATLASTYGAHYLDVREYLVSLFDAGDPTDVADHDNDVVPTSLRTDFQHLDNAGYQDVANYIYAHRAELGLP